MFGYCLTSCLMQTFMSRIVRSLLAVCCWWQKSSKLIRLYDTWQTKFVMWSLSSCSLSWLDCLTFVIDNKRKKAITIRYLTWTSALPVGMKLKNSRTSKNTVRYVICNCTFDNHILGYTAHRVVIDNGSARDRSIGEPTFVIECIVHVRFGSLAIINEHQL